MNQFFGKYRGQVTANQDPLNLGRIQVTVPAIFGDYRDSWALPCVPYAGEDIGLFMIPPVGANIWVEFEGGNPDYPIWSGCFWGEKELPQAAQVEEPDKVQVFRTKGVTLTVSNEDKTPGIVLEVTKPMLEKTLKLTFNPEGIELNHDDKMTIACMTKADKIELKHGSNSTVTLTADNVNLKQTNIEANLTNNSIELNCNPASIQLKTSSGIELKNMPAKTTLSTSGIELSSTPASVKIGAPGVGLMSGGLGKINISPASVNIN